MLKNSQPPKLPEGCRIFAAAFRDLWAAKLVDGRVMMCGIPVPKFAEVRVVYPPQFLAEANELAEWLKVNGWPNSRAWMEEPKREKTT